MRIYDNGVYRDATEAEVEDIMNASYPTEEEPTLEDRLADLESAFEALLSGRTE